jgi:hypothetical protein
LRHRREHTRPLPGTDRFLGNAEERCRGATPERTEALQRVFGHPAEHGDALVAVGQRTGDRGHRFDVRHDLHRQLLVRVRSPHRVWMISNPSRFLGSRCATPRTLNPDLRARVPKA